MKKITLLSAVILLFATNCLAQDKGYVAVAIGAAVPVGDFGSTSQSNDGSGYAKTGPNFDISFARKFTKYIGISALMRASSNAFDVKTAEKQFEANYPGLNFNISDDSWKTLSFMAGGYASFPMSSKLSFDARLMGGIMSVASPEINTTVYGPSGSAWVDTDSATSASFCYLVGGGFKYNVASKICFLANIDLVSAKANFKNVRSSSSDGSNSFGDFSQNLTTVNIGFGVGYRL